MYEAAEIVAMGAAHELILGAKPFMWNVDNEGVSNRADEIDDIDELDA